MIEDAAITVLVSIAASAAHLASSASAAAIIVAKVAERERAVNTKSTRPSHPSTSTTARPTATAASKPTLTTVVGFGRGTTTTAKRPPVQKPATARTKPCTKVTSSSHIPKESKPAKNTQDKKMKSKDVTPSPSAAASSGNDTKDEFKHTTTTDRKVPPIAARIATNDPVEPRVAEPKDTHPVRKDTRAKTDTAKDHKEDILSGNRVRSRDEAWVDSAFERADIFGIKIASSDTGGRRTVEIDATPARRTRREQQPTLMRGRKLKTADLADEDAYRTGRQAKASADFNEEKTTQEGGAGSTGMTVRVESAVPGEETPWRVSRPPALAGLDRAALSSTRTLAHTPGSAFRPISHPESHRYAFQSHGPQTSDRAMSTKSPSTDSNGIPVRATSVPPHLGAPVRLAEQESTLARPVHAFDATTTVDSAPKAPLHAESAWPTLSFRNSAPIGVPQESVSAAAARFTTTTNSHRGYGVADHRQNSNAGLHERSAKSEDARGAIVPMNPSRQSRDPTLREALELSSTSSSDAGNYAGSHVSEVARPHELHAPVRRADQQSTLAPSAHAHEATTTGDFASKSPPHAASASSTLLFRNSAPIAARQESVSAAAAPTPARLTTATHSRRNHGAADHRQHSNAGLHERSAKSEDARGTFVPIPSRPSRDPTLREALELSSTSSSDAGRDTGSDVSEVARPPVPFVWHRQRDPLRVALELSSTSSSDAGSHEGSDVSEVARPHVPLARPRQRSSLHEAPELSSSGGFSVTPNDLSHKVAGYRIGGSTAVSPSSALPHAPQSQGPSITRRHSPVTCGNTTDRSPAASSEAPPVASATYSALSSNAPEPMVPVTRPRSASSATTAARLATRNTHSSVGFDAAAGGVAPPLSAHSAFRRHTPSVPNPIVTVSPHYHTSSIVGSASERTNVAEGSLRPSSAAAARLVTRVRNHDELSDSADSRVGEERRWERAKATLRTHELKYGPSCSHGDSRHESSEHQSSNASTISSSGLSREGAPAPDVHDLSDDGDEDPSGDEWTRDALAHADIHGRQLEEGSPRSESQHEESEGEMGRESKARRKKAKVLQPDEEDQSSGATAQAADGGEVP